MKKILDKYLKGFGIKDITLKSLGKKGEYHNFTFQKPNIMIIGKLLGDKEVHYFLCNERAKGMDTIMKVAICEDSVKMLSKLEEIVCDCFSNKRGMFSCDTYMSGEELLDKQKANYTQYHIYLLDIEMKEINGLEVATFIRKKDRNAIIIFVSCHSEHMQEAFEVVAFHFLVKPINEQKAKQVILRAIEMQNLMKNTFHFKVRKKIITLYFEQIEYFESYKRKIYIHTEEGIHEYYGILKEVAYKIDPSLFVQIHNSFIVNMDYIKFTDAVSVILDSGVKVAITKKYYKEFNLTYRNYLLKRMI